MSRIGKQLIEIPEKTEVAVSDNVVVVKGPLGELKRPYKDEVKVAVEGKEIKVTPNSDSSLAHALWGTYASHISNMIQGVNKEFEKKLVIEGVGYKAEVSGSNIVLNVGYSHPVELAVPEGVKVEVAKNVVSVSGIDKETVGEFSANIRAVRKPEPYKGKGIRYDDEVIRRKQGKRSVT